MSDDQEIAGDINVEDGSAPGGRRRMDLWMFVAALLLSLATLATAWASYEASRWGGHQTVSNSRATAARIAANDQSSVANRQMLTDILLFSDWFSAELSGNTDVSGEVRRHFRAEFVPFFEQWYGAATDLRETRGTPFDTGSYRLKATVKAERLLDEAQAATDQAGVASTIADGYVLTAVLYASVLFLAGISSKVPGLAAQRFTIALSGVAFLGASAFLLNLPIFQG